MMRAIPTAARAAATVCARAATAGPAPVARAASATASAAAPHPAAAAAAACAAKFAVAGRSVSIVPPCEKTDNTLTIKTPKDRALFMSLPQGSLPKLTEVVLEGDWDAEAIKHLKLLAPHLTTLTMSYSDLNILNDLADELTGLTMLVITHRINCSIDISLTQIMTMAPDAQNISIIGPGFYLEMDPHDDPSAPKYPNLHELNLHDPSIRSMNIINRPPEADGTLFFQNLAQAARLEYLNLTGKVDSNVLQAVKANQDRLGIISASGAETAVHMSVTEALTRE